MDASGPSSRSTFVDCLLWATENSVWSLRMQKPYFKLHNCRIYGTACNLYGSDDPNQALQFYGCHFEDYEGEYDGMIFGVQRSGLACILHRLMAKAQRLVRVRT